MMDSDGYEKIALVDTDGHVEFPESSPTINVSSTQSQISEGQSIQFARAAFAFRDNLQNVRKKHTEVLDQAAPAAPAAPSPLQATPHDNTTKADDPIKGDDPGPKPDDPVAARRLRILRLVQSILTSFLSIAIAALQTKVYVNYQQTKHIPGAWPTHPNVLPTIMLLVTAALAGTLDLSLLLAYFFRAHAKAFFRIATQSYDILTCIKGVAYLYVSVVCRGGFNYGNSSGQNNDLWGWTCGAAADKLNSVTQASANCGGQVSDDDFNLGIASYN